MNTVASKQSSQNFFIAVRGKYLVNLEITTHFFSTTLKQPAKSRPDLRYFLDGIRDGNRIVLAKAITLAESTLASDQELAAQLMEALLPHTGNSIRIGITGAPGVGKSTFIEAFGKHLIELGNKVAVLTIDPSSQKTKGSILGDKTRMDELSKNPNAFIRPSSSGDALGGVAHKTRESLLLCEAAGYNIILIETVGVGQSEVMVKEMSDFFLLLMLPGSGDELQGIKKGIMEMADLVVITKAEGDAVKKAKKSQAEFQHAIHLFHHKDSLWTPKVLTTSSITLDGIPEVYQEVGAFVARMKSLGEFDRNRSSQNIAHMHDHFNQLLKAMLLGSSPLQEKIKSLESDVNEKKLTSTEAARRMLSLFQQELRG